MGKTHEALMRAEKEYQKSAIVTSDSSQRALVPQRPKRGLLQPAPRWYEEIKSRLEVQFPNDSLKTILFTGSSHGVGVSMTSHGYAEYLANAYPYKVLLIEIDLHDVQTNKPDSDNPLNRFSEKFSGYSQMGDLPDQNHNGNLFTITCAWEALGAASSFQSNQFDEFLQSVRGSFDFVILDAPPVTLFSGALMICSKVDGVILVLEFGKTRKQVACKAQEELEAAGGNFLGVVINKRKYYIPDWLYKRL